MQPKPKDDYEQGEMMGMLVIIMMLEQARQTKTPIPDTTLEKIKRIASESLADYLKKPEEDVILSVENQLRNI